MHNNLAYIGYRYATATCYAENMFRVDVNTHSYNAIEYRMMVL